MPDTKFNITSGFYDSINDDRLYSADDMNRPYRRIISEGIFATQKGTPSTDLQVLASSGCNIIVKKGEGLLGAKWFENPSDLSITVPQNTNIVPRYDSVIVQVDKTKNGRNANIIYREGTASSDPQPPAINNTTSIFELRIANIYVEAGAVVIGQDVITDMRGSKDCPWITHLLKQVDTSELFNQWQEAYKKYYDSTTKTWNEFMSNLTEDLIVNTNIIKYESHFVTEGDSTAQIPINILNYNKNKDILIVKINRLFTSEGIDYTISDDGSKIILTKAIAANQNIDFLVLQCVIAGDTETALNEIQKLNNVVSELKQEVEKLKAQIS